MGVFLQLSKHFLPCEHARKAQGQSGVCSSAESGERLTLRGVSGSRGL